MPAPPGQARIALSDGSAVVVRPIEPADRDTYLAGFERVSPESRYRRFLTPVDHLSTAQVDYMVNVDHRDHEALIAIDEATGDGVGIGRFVRTAGDPEVAEAAVVVIDDWQGRGLGTALARVL